MKKKHVTLRKLVEALISRLQVIPKDPIITHKSEEHPSGSGVIIRINYGEMSYKVWALDTGTIKSLEITEMTKLGARQQTWNFTESQQTPKQ